MDYKDVLYFALLCYCMYRTSQVWKDLHQWWKTCAPAIEWKNTITSVALQSRHTLWAKEETERIFRFCDSDNSQVLRKEEIQSFLFMSGLPPSWVMTQFPQIEMLTRQDVETMLNKYRQCEDVGTQPVVQTWKELFFKGWDTLRMGWIIACSTKLWGRVPRQSVSVILRSIQQKQCSIIEALESPSLASGPPSDPIPFEWKIETGLDWKPQDTWRIWKDKTRDMDPSMELYLYCKPSTLFHQQLQLFATSWNRHRPKTPLIVQPQNQGYKLYWANPPAMHLCMFIAECLPEMECVIEWGRSCWSIVSLEKVSLTELYDIRIRATGTYIPECEYVFPFLCGWLRSHISLQYESLRTWNQLLTVWRIPNLVLTAFRSLWNSPEEHWIPWIRKTQIPQQPWIGNAITRIQLSCPYGLCVNWESQNKTLGIS